MVKQIFVNLAVESLPRAVEFFTALGFSFDPQYTDENATCLILGKNIFAMLLVKPFFQGFTPKALCDPGKATEVINALAVDSRAEVDALVAKAVAAGGQASGEPKDYGFMYQHGFQDPDGHLWEVFHASGAPPA
ncbi:MAG TPA: VOC family protein [Stenotrophomonas sp.]|nr:VOC family protein [Stenotrophomonas sp.]